MEYDAAFNVVYACYRVAFGVFLRIAAAYEHYAYGRTLVELYRAAVEIAFGHALEQVYDVALKPQHDALGLRVAHAAVVFYNHRVAPDVYKSEEYETLVVEPFLGKTFHRRADYAVFYLLHPLLRGERNWRNAAHAARIEASVVLADALVVLRFRQNLIVLAVGKDENGTFDAAQELFDDDVCRSVTEHSAEHLAQFLLGFVECREYQYAFTGAQSVGLEHVRRLQCFEETQPLVERRTVECLVTCRRYVVPLHETFGKIL